MRHVLNLIDRSMQEDLGLHKIKVHYRYKTCESPCPTRKLKQAKMQLSTVFTVIGFFNVNYTDFGLVGMTQSGYEMFWHPQKHFSYPKKISHKAFSSRRPPPFQIRRPTLHCYRPNRPTDRRSGRHRVMCTPKRRGAGRRSAAVCRLIFICGPLAPT